MYALRVTINNKRTVVAAAKDLSVLSAIVTMTGCLGPETDATDRDKPNMHIHVGGLTARRGKKADEHLRWLPHTKLRVGDRVLVEVIESEKAGRIVERSKAGAKSNDERYYYKQLKKQYLQLKKKYEPES